MLRKGITTVFCILVTITLLLFRHARNNVVYIGVTKIRTKCESEACTGEPEMGQELNNLQETANGQVSDHTLYSNRKMTVKLGSDLKFDISRCPKNSSMLPGSTRQFSTPKHRNCPTLYIVGARKGGTSSLYQYISKHPDFQGIMLDAGSRVGEPLYLHKSPLIPWKRYMSLFPSNGKMTGESSVANLVSDFVPKRLHEVCGRQSKVVMLLRDPIKRLESNVLMRVRHSRIGKGKDISTLVNSELDTYFKAVAKRIDNISNGFEEWSKLTGLFFPSRNLVFEGLYYAHLLNWLCNFPAENMLIIRSEQFYRNPSKILDIVIQFLGLRRLGFDTYDEITSVIYNEGSYNVSLHQRLSQTDIENLLEVYRPFNKVLLELLQWDHDTWLQ